MSTLSFVYPGRSWTGMLMHILLGIIFGNFWAWQSPHVQYQQTGSPQPQYAPQFNQFEQMQQQMQGVPQQTSWADMIADVIREQFVSASLS